MMLLYLGPPVHATVHNVMSGEQQIRRNPSALLHSSIVKTIIIIIIIFFSSSSPVCTSSWRFVQQDLQVRQLFEALGTDGDVTLPALQLFRRGHRHAIQSAQPERSIKGQIEALEKKKVCTCRCVSSPAHGAGAQHSFLRDQAENLLQVLQKAPRDDEAHGGTEDVSISKDAAQTQGVYNLISIIIYS